MSARANTRVLLLAAAGALAAGCASGTPSSAPAATPAARQGPEPRAASAAAPGARVEDPLHADIQHALRQQQGLDASAIDIHVQGGIVQLTGSVRSLKQKARVRRAVLAVKGVSSVSVDGLTVTSAVGH